MMTDTNDTRFAKVDPVKLMGEINARPDVWLNLIQTMSETTADELNDDPNGHANFETLLAHALGEHTERWDAEGNETAWLDIFETKAL